MSQKKKTNFKILMPPDDLSDIKKNIKKFRIKKLRKMLVPAVLLFLAVCGTYLLLKNQTYSQVRTAQQYMADISDASSYARFQKGVVRYNRDGVVFLNNRNEEQWIQPAQIRTPVIVTSEEAFAVADNGGNNIMVFTAQGLKGEIETTLPIEKIAVSNQGIVSAVLRDENSPKIVSYDATGNILVEQKASVGTTGYPTALSLSNDGRMLAVSYLYTEGRVIRSRVVFYNFGEKGQEKADNIVASDEYDDTVTADIFFMGQDRIVAAGDNGFIVYQGREEPRKEKEVKVDQEIQSAFHSDQYIGFVLLNEEKSGYEVRLYNRLGEQVINRAIPAKYDHVKMDGDEILMFDGTGCCIVTATGIIKYKGDIGLQTLEMFRAPGLNRYYVMSVDELRIIYLTK